MSVLRPVGTLLLALVTQYAFTSLDLGLSLRTLFSSLTQTFAVEPEAPPRVTDIARSERDINEQQRQSAEQQAAFVSREHMDAPAPQPDDVRWASPESALQEDLVMRCGEKLPPESVWVTRGVNIHVKSGYEGERASDCTITRPALLLIARTSARTVRTDCSHAVGSDVWQVVGSTRGDTRCASTTRATTRCRRVCSPADAPSV